MTFISRTINASEICQRADDGYIHATAMCKEAGKRWDDYKTNDNTQAYLGALSSETGIPVSQLVLSKRGNS